MLKTKLTLALIAILIVSIALTVTTSAVLQDQKAVPAGGKVSSTVGIDVYTNAAATNPCTNIDWGNITQGTQTTKTVYLKNTGNTPETLHMRTSDWTPTTAASLLSLSWDKEGSSLAPGCVVAATLTLSTAANVGDLDSFSLNIIFESSA